MDRRIRKFREYVRESHSLIGQDNEAGARKAFREADKYLQQVVIADLKEDETFQRVYWNGWTELVALFDLNAGIKRADRSR